MAAGPDTTRDGEGAGEHEHQDQRSTSQSPTAPQITGLCGVGRHAITSGRALSAEIAFEAERMAHAHLIRCRDFDCGLYRLMVDQAVTAASRLVDEEMHA